MYICVCLSRLRQRRRALHPPLPAGEVHRERGSDLHRRNRLGLGTFTQGTVVVVLYIHLAKPELLISRN